MGTRLATVLFSVSALAVAQDPPEVVSLEPAHGAEVDAKTTKQLVVVFDRAMDPSGWSFCGGGPQFPPFEGKPRWQDGNTKLVAAVKLEPDHEYRLSLNCPAAQNTRSAAGVALVPVPWSFTTLPEKTRPAAEQKARNQRALALLMKELPQRYSYHDLRVADWKALEQQHAPAILAARTDRGFAAAVGEMLRATGDVHVSVQLGEQRFAGGTRAVDPLFRRELLDRYVRVEPVGPQALAGRTADDLGYLMIGGWTKEVDPDRIGGAITELADTKGLVIDARPNAGGDERVAQRVAAWFVEGTKTYAKHRVRQRAGANGFGPVIERQLTGNPESHRYDRPIVVLTSRYVMSSNEAFVLMLRQAKDCTVVGQPTFGSSGNPQPCELSNGVVVHLPCWQALRPDGTPFEGEGLAPDVVVECAAKDFERGDPILAKALELLRAKVDAGK